MQAQGGRPGRERAAGPAGRQARTVRHEPEETRTPYKDITTYNNFYEFGTDKADPAANAHRLKTRPWTVAFEGEIAKPQVLDIDTLLKRFPLEERVYRLRCVEAWSMVIPWVGFPLGPLIKQLEPTSRAKYVAFTTKLAPDQMPGLRTGVLEWPYVEGLRMDEAMHPLTILAVGLYGRVLPNQNGAPIRLVVPWKYGFKSIKSIVRVRFVENAAADQLEPPGAGRVRLLLERESRGRSPALEPGRRTPHRRAAAAQDAAVQRLRQARSPGCTRAWTCARSSSVRRQTRGRRNLKGFRTSRDELRAAKPRFALARWRSWPSAWWRCCPPRARRAALLDGDLGANPIAEAMNRLGFWTLTLLLATLARRRIQIVTGWKWPLRLRRMLGLVAFLYVCLHFAVYLGVDQFFDFAADREGHRQAQVHHRRVRGVPAADSAGHHLDRRDGAAARASRAGSGCTGWSTSPPCWASCTSSGA